MKPGERKRRERPGEDRDDRERDREVREATPGTRKVLLVAHLREPLLVAPRLIDVGNAFRWCHFPLPPSRPLHIHVLGAYVEAVSPALGTLRAEADIRQVGFARFAELVRKGQAGMR